MLKWWYIRQKIKIIVSVLRELIPSASLFLATVILFVQDLAPSYSPPGETYVCVWPTLRISISTDLNLKVGILQHMFKCMLVHNLKYQYQWTSTLKASFIEK